ncbi:cytochrome P450 [Entophlyctis helioformis]|nr:cytochrome P450 [Entophlyctis helioformis]
MLLDAVQQVVSDVVAAAQQNPAIAAAVVVGGAAAATALALQPGRSSKKRLPRPMGLPIIGSAREFSEYGSTGKIHELFAMYNRMYGPTLEVNLGAICLVLTSDHALIHRALTDTTEFSRDDFLEQTAKGLIDDALFFLPSGERWKRHRKFLQPAFAPAQLRHGGQVVKEHTVDLMDYWTEMAAANGGSVITNIYDEFTAYTMDVIGLVGFSHNLRGTELLHKNIENKSSKYLKSIMDILQRRIAIPFFMWGYYGIGTRSPAVIEMRDHFDKLFKGIIAEKRAASDAGANTDKPQDILDRLLAGSDERAVFSDAEVLGEMKAFFLAGHETTAHTLSFIALELSRNPDVQQRLRVEINAVLSTLNGDIQPDRLADFTYLDAVVKETMRLHPVAGRIGRQTEIAIEHDGYTLPAKTIILLLISEANIDPQVWPNPTRFNPDRWQTPPPPGFFIPFGDGPMNCIGQKLAMIEIKIAIIMLIQKFTIELVPDQNIEFVTNLTLGLKEGLKVKLTPVA